MRTVEVRLRSGFFCVPKCHDELSVVEVPIATAWRVGRRPALGTLSFCPGMTIAVLNAMPSPQHAVHLGARRGFTLLKILTAIAVVSPLGIAAIICVPKMWPCMKTPNTPVGTDAAALAAAAEAFIVGHGSEECPTPEEMQRDGVLSSRSKTEDPWGTPYRIVCAPDSAIAISAGRDQTFDTDDDVKSDDP